jgi:hypothetical protein
MTSEDGYPCQNIGPELAETIVEKESIIAANIILFISFFIESPLSPLDAAMWKTVPLFTFYHMFPFHHNKIYKVKAHKLTYTPLL